MTKREALQAIITFECSANLIEKALIDSNVDGDEYYDSTCKKEIDLFLAELCFIVANSPDWTEGNSSIQLDRQVLLNTRSSIFKKYGIEENEGIISCDPVW